MEKMTQVTSPYRTWMERKTKIICTIGPASESEEVLAAMMDAGMDVARLNFSHGTYEDHTKKIELIRRLRTEKKRPVALLLDTKGPEVRLGTFKNGKTELKTGEIFTLASMKRKATRSTFPSLIPTCGAIFPTERAS